MIPRDNHELVNFLRSKNALYSQNLISAFEKMDRKFFVPKQLSTVAYMDRPLPIAPGTTISQPTTVAFMLELLQPRKGQKILDVGAGSGWTLALLSEIVGEEGTVLGTELSRTLVETTNPRLKKLGIENAEIELAEKELGKPGETFDRILVSAAAEKRVPQTLLEQLKVGGRLVIPVDDAIVLVEHPEENVFNEKQWKGFMFVPLR